MSGPKKDLGFYRDVSRITIQGLAGITNDFKQFYEDISAKVHPALVDITESDLPEASDQLNAIITATEEAATKIMDVLEERQEDNMVIRTALKKALGQESLDNDSVEALEKADSCLNANDSRIIKIFEELSFQDLTGQRIRKIVNLVQKIEHTVEAIIGNVGKKIGGDSPVQETAPSDVSELKGPQEKGKGMDQSAIDDLLSAL